MKSTSGGVQLFVHLVLGVGTNQAYIALMRHCCTSTAQRLWFGAHLCTSPIIYKAEIIVIKSVMSEHNSVFCSTEIKKATYLSAVSYIICGKYFHTQCFYIAIRQFPVVLHCVACVPMPCQSCSSGHKTIFYQYPLL